MMEEVVKFLQNAVFIPTPSTLTNFIKNGNLATWPMMMEENVKRVQGQKNQTNLTK